MGDAADDVYDAMDRDMHNWDPPEEDEDMIVFTHPTGRPMDAETMWTVCGFIPTFLSANDPLGAVEQINANYGHGGGWCDSVNPWKASADRLSIYCYPEDPPFYARAKARLRDEEIVIYDHGYVGVFQPDGSFRIARID